MEPHSAVRDAPGHLLPSWAAQKKTMKFLVFAQNYYIIFVTVRSRRHKMQTKTLMRQKKNTQQKKGRNPHNSVKWKHLLKTVLNCKHDSSLSKAAGETLLWDMTELS